jgi:hypothetical protein
MSSEHDPLLLKQCQKQLITCPYTRYYENVRRDNYPFVMLKLVIRRLSIRQIASHPVDTYFGWSYSLLGCRLRPTHQTHHGELHGSSPAAVCGLDCMCNPMLFYYLSKHPRDEYVYRYPVALT